MVINRPGRNPHLQAFLKEHVNILWSLGSDVLIGTVKDHNAEKNGAIMDKACDPEPALALTDLPERFMIEYTIAGRDGKLEMGITAGLKSPLLLIALSFIHHYQDY
ncbi:hypothetical protein LTR40_006645 [Exophiala xenobiotica]|nr:hypothetical protein LTS06_012795 [Exophiala xenobiotica]KAK5280236.1 hypothetical protein LTR40_006645 [Exophiala xenobiotica]